MEINAGHFIVIVCSLALLCNAVDNTSLSNWTAWSSCSKSCDIGTQYRQHQHVETGQVTGLQVQYCNLQYCPEDWKNCSDQNTFGYPDCYPRIRDGSGKCVAGRCHCTLGPGYNLYYCLPEVGNCIIRQEPITAIGYKDPRLSYPYSYSLYSCTTNDNLNYEVHVVGIYGENWRKDYEISIVPRGPITKPVVLILTSFNPTHWKIITNVGLYKVLYGGSTRNNGSTVRVTSSCPYDIQWKYKLDGHGTDTGGGDTLELLQQIYYEFGPVTSFTGYYELSAYPKSKIIVHIGGNPLRVYPHNYQYRMSSDDCSYFTPPTTVAASTTTTYGRTTLHDTYLHYTVEVVLKTFIYRNTMVEKFMNRKSTEFQEIKNAIEKYWWNTLHGSLKDFTVNEMEKKHLEPIVKLRLSVLPDKVGYLIHAAYELSRGNLYVLIRNTQISARSISITDIFNLHSVEIYYYSYSDNLCEFLSELKGCNENYDCKQYNKIPTCVYRKKPEADTSSFTAIIVSISTIIILVIGIIIFVIRQRYRRYVPRLNNFTRGNLPQTQNTAIYTTGNTDEFQSHSLQTQFTTHNTDSIPSQGPPTYESLSHHNPPSYCEALKTLNANNMNSSVL